MLSPPSLSSINESQTSIRSFDLDLAGEARPPQRSLAPGPLRFYQTNDGAVELVFLSTTVPSLSRTCSINVGSVSLFAKVLAANRGGQNADELASRYAVS